MVRRDRKPIPADRPEIRLFAKVRNESARLPYFFDYYFRLGVDRIFIVSNNSTDTTIDVAIERERVHVFETREHFRKHFCWIEVLLDWFGEGHWCLIADADEFLVWPDFENSSLPVLTAYLEQHRYTALHAIALDMFPGGPISKARYETGSDPLKAFPYFDTQYRREPVVFRNRRTGARVTGATWMGGARGRAFGVTTWLSKVPLFKHGPEIAVFDGHHVVDGDRPADVTGAVLHFKYLPTFMNYVREEVRRGQYRDGAEEYRDIKRVLDGESDDDFSLYWDGACKYENTTQLLQLGLLKTSDNFTRFTHRSPLTSRSVARRRRARC